MTSPWVDGEQLTAAKMYARVTALITSLTTQLANLVEGGSDSVTIASGSNANTKAITFTKTYTTPPLVSITAQSGANVQANLNVAVTTTGFTVRTFATSGNNVASATTVNFMWTAIRV